MNERIRSLQAKATEALARAEEIRDRYKGTDEAFSAEDEEALEKAFAEYDRLKASIDSEKRALDVERDRTEPIHVPSHAEPSVEDDEKAANYDAERHVKLFDRYLRAGERGVSPQELAYLKDLSADDSVEGGFITAPRQFVNQLLQNVDNDVVIRQLATIYQVDRAESLGVPTLENDISDAEWTAELGTPTVDTAMDFGARELFPHQLTKEAKVSRKLLRRSVQPVESLVRARMAYKFGVALENAYMNGNGDRQPLGLFVASASGIPTSRDSNTGSTTDFTADGLINAKHELKPQYWSNARWLFHRYAVRNIRKLKDGDGTYIWQSGLQQDLPPSILELPYVVSEYAPSTFTANSYIGMLGDFRNYWIADALDFNVQVLLELYARTNQIGFIGRLESDGQPVLAEAFIRLKLAE